MESAQQREYRVHSVTTGKICKSVMHIYEKSRLGLTFSRASDKYRSNYSYDEASDTIHGCPAKSSTIQTFIKLIKAKSRAKGTAATQHHAEAMKIKDLAAIMQWSECEVPPESLAKRGGNLKIQLKHTMMRAFLSSGYTLWTRYVRL